MGQGVHDRPGNVGVPGGVCAGRAVSDLTAARGAAFYRQEGLSDVVPTCIPLDTAALDRVLRFEHQGVFGFKAVVDRGRTRVEVAHQVEHAVTDAGGIDTDVLHVEAFGKSLDLLGLVLERLAAPTVLFQNPELAPILQRWGNDHAAGIVAGAAGVVADPYRAVAERARVVWVVVCPKRQVGVATLQVS